MRTRVHLHRCSGPKTPEKVGGRGERPAACTCGQKACARRLKKRLNKLPANVDVKRRNWSVCSGQVKCLAWSEGPSTPCDCQAAPASSQSPAQRALLAFKYKHTRQAVFTPGRCRVSFNTDPAIVTRPSCTPPVVINGGQHNVRMHAPSHDTHYTVLCVSSVHHQLCRASSSATVET